MRKAFTLVELLVVIAVLAVLAAVLFPVLGAAQATAKNAGCVSNLRQIGLGIAGYCNDHDGTLPGPLYSGVYSGFGSGPPSGQSLSNFIAPYLAAVASNGSQKQLNEVFLCPSFEQVTTVATRQSGFAFYCNSNGRNSGGASMTNGDGTSACPWGHPGGGYNEAPMRLINWAGMLSGSSTAKRVFGLVDTWAVQDADVTNYPATAYTGMPDKPVHRSHWNRLYFDWHVGSAPLSSPYY